MRITVLALVLMGAGMIGCSAKTRLGDGYVVEPEKLSDEIAAHSRANDPVVLLDVRARDQYVAGHLPGAVWIDLAVWMKQSRSGGGLNNADDWRKRFGENGIGADDAVLVYDGGELTEAARVWYLLQLFGATRVAVLDGGYPAADVILPPPRETGEPKPTTPKAFHPAGSHGAPAVALTEKQGVRAAADGHDVQVLDVRTRKEFDGTDARGNPRTGHVPGALNLPHKELLDARGRLKDANSIRREFETAGVRADRTIVAHCQSGGRSSLAALAAARAGFRHVSNYYMSFSEWSADETCPLQRDAAQSERLAPSAGPTKAR